MHKIVQKVGRVVLCVMLFVVGFFSFQILEVSRQEHIIALIDVDEKTKISLNHDLTTGEDTINSEIILAKLPLRQYTWITPWMALGAFIISLILLRYLKPKYSLQAVLICILVFFILGQARYWYFYLYPMHYYNYLKAAIIYRMSLHLVVMNGYLFLAIFLGLYMMMKKGEEIEDE